MTCSQTFPEGLLLIFFEDMPLNSISLRSYNTQSNFYIILKYFMKKQYEMSSAQDSIMKCIAII